MSSSLRAQAAEALRQMGKYKSPTERPDTSEGVTFSNLSFDVDDETKQRVDREREEFNKKIGLKK